MDFYEKNVKKFKILVEKGEMNICIKMKNNRTKFIGLYTRCHKNSENLAEDQHS